MSELATTNGQPASINAAIGNNGVILRSFDELARFARMVASSGFAPKGMEKEAAIGVAIQAGLELGLSPLQSLQSMAVINGRPAIYGDAAKALVEASGLMDAYDQWYEAGGKRLTTADGHNRTPTAAELKDESLTCCVMSRRNGRKELVTTFSVGDARAAGLWGKAGPWSQYAARMLLFRARGFNMRDNFGDVLKGLRTVEEAADTPIDVTPIAEAKSPPLALADKLRERAAIVEQAKQAEPALEHEPQPAVTAAQPEIPAEDDAEVASADAIQELQSLAARRYAALRQWKAAVKETFGIASVEMLTPAQAAKELERLKAMPELANA